MKFHSPYQFINIRPAKAKISYKINKEKQKEIESDFVRHDYWHKKGLSGSIQCTLTTVSPLVVGAKQEQGSNDKQGKVYPYKQRDKVALPANSLRGMIGSLAENISSSSLRVLARKSDSIYSVRKDMYSSIKTMGLLRKNDEGQFILYKLSNAVMLDRKDVQELKAYQHQDIETNSNFYYATITPIKNRHGIFEDHALGLSKTKSEGQVKGVHYIRGDVSNRKTHETFIPWDGELPKTSINVNELVNQLETTLQQYAEKKDAEKSLPIGYNFKKNDKGEELPVVSDGDLIYYKEERINNVMEITELSYSQIWRKPVNGNLYDAIQREYDKDTLPWNKDRNSLSPVEALFGVVEDNFDTAKGARNLASRVQFTDATSSKEIELLDPVTLKILDSPKPPSPSMYFSGDGYIAKKDLDLTMHKPNGRKHYLPRKDPQNESHWKTNNTDVNRWNQYLSCEPIPASTKENEVKFTFKIHFENLSEQELGLLQTTIKPRNDGEDFIHRLGLGKPLGLGQVKLNIDIIKIINRKKRYNLEQLGKEREQTYTEVPNLDLVDTTTLEELKILYNPKNIKYDVCYPYSSIANPRQEQGNESEGFEWFVTNDQKKKTAKNQQYLETIKVNKEIPWLHSFDNDD